MRNIRKTIIVFIIHILLFVSIINNTEIIHPSLNQTYSFSISSLSTLDDLSFNSPDIGTAFYEAVSDNLVKFVSTLKNDTLSDSCIVSLNKNAKNINFLQKLILDSAKNKNDLGSYNDCKRIIYNDTKDEKQSKHFLDQLGFLIVSIKDSAIDPETGNQLSKFDIRYEQGNFIVGFCVVDGCTNTEFESVIRQINSFLYSFGLGPDVDIIINNMNDVSAKLDIFFVLSMLFIVVIITFVIFTCFPALPTFIFKYCFSCLKNRNGKLELSRESEFSCNSLEIKEESKKSHILDVKEFTNSTSTHKNDTRFNEVMLNKFSDCFDINQNFEYNDYNNTNNSNFSKKKSGIAFLDGLTSICMIFFSLNLVYYSLFNSPLKIYCQNTYKHLVLSYSYSIFVFAQRHACTILFSINGFSLTYKMLCFLDKELENQTSDEERVSIKEVSDKEKDQLKPNNNNEQKDHDNYEDKSNDKSNIDKSINKDNKTCTDKTRTKSITVSFLEALPTSIKSESCYKFIKLQSYKYLIFIVFILFFKISMFEVNALFNNAAPAWINLKQYVYDRFLWTDLVKSIFLLDTFLPKNLETCSTFWFIINDMIFFLITTTIIFLSYKKSWRLDRIFIYLALSFILLKIVIYALFIVFDIGFYTSSVFTGQQSNFYLFHPIFNYSVHNIGCFFGMLNYTIQKSYCPGSIKRAKKYFLTIPANLMISLRGLKSFTVGVISVLGLTLIFIDCLSVKIVYELFGYAKSDPYMSEVYKNIGLNFFNLINVDVVVFINFIILMSIYLKGNNMIINFLSSRHWSIISSTYFFFLLSAYPLISITLYQSDSRIRFNFVNIMFIAMYSLLVLLITNYILTVLFEIPARRLFRLYIDFSYKVKEKKLLEEDESARSIK